MRVRKSTVLFGIGALSLVILKVLTNSETVTSDKIVSSDPLTEVPTNDFLDRNRRKTILLWGHIGLQRDFYYFGGGQEAFFKNKCRITNCYITDRRSALPYDQYDAILFHIGYMNATPPELPRKPHQRYVYFNLEPPYRVLEKLDNYRGYFNWTMTYRNDSDVQFPYGKIKATDTAPKNEQEAQHMVKFYSDTLKPRVGKTKRKAIWFVSNCKTPGKREKLVRKLQKWLPVDIYGNCGVYRCKRKGNAMPECYQHMQENYKFYFSFENSIVKDYVTEKFYRVLDYDIVPVVYGGADYSSIAPYHSYIDATHLTPKQLAEHLAMLDANETLYRGYFWWKEHYKVLHFDQNFEDEHPFCKLCEKLNEINDTTKTYNVAGWEKNGIVTT